MDEQTRHLTDFHKWIVMMSLLRTAQVLRLDSIKRIRPEGSSIVGQLEWDNLLNQGPTLR